MANFERLTRPGMRSLAPGQRISEHGICYEKLSNGDGKFSIQLRIDGEKVHRTIGKESEGVTRGDAEALIERLKTESREGRLKLPKGRKLEMRFAEAVEKYKERLKEIGGRNMKRKSEQFKLHLVPFFGSKPITQISSFDVERYKQSRRTAGAANATINQELANLSHLYSSMKAWGWIQERPFAIKKLPEEQTRITYLTSEQCKRLLDESRKLDHELYLFVRIGLATGMRLSEILSIRLGDIDLAHNRIFIPKAKTGARNQPITAELAEYLTFYRKEYCKDGQVWLFPSKKSKTGHRVSVRKNFRKAVKAAKLDPAIVLRHTLRHTVVSTLVQAGVDIHTIMDISGHKTQTMVQRYSHRDGEHIQQAMDKLEDKLQAAKEWQKEA